MLRRPMVGVALSVVLMMSGVPSAVAVQPARHPRLDGETLSATMDSVQYDWFVPTCRSQGTSTIHFEFEGTAAGPYPGTYRESGTISYTFAGVLPGSGDQTWGTVKSFSATFAITSPVGTVTGRNRFVATGEEDFCDGGLGGEVFWTSLATRYAATITTPGGSYQDRGTSTAILGGEESLAIAGQSTLAESFGVPPEPPANTQPPTAWGSNDPGQTLTAWGGTWTNTPTSYSHRWLRCDGLGDDCRAIIGATGRTYTLTPADDGGTIRVQEWATNDVGTGGPAVSAPTGVIQVLPAPSPSSNPTPSVPSPESPSGGTPAAASGMQTISIQASPTETRAQLLKQLGPLEKPTIAALLKNGGDTFRFTTLGSGRIFLDWYYVPGGARLSRVEAKPRPVLVASGKATFARARQVKVAIRLTAAGRRLLDTSTSLTLTAKATYAPSGQSGVTATKRFTLTG